MLNHGISVMVVSRRLGHARPSITMDVYGYLIPTMQADAADIIAGLLSQILVEAKVLAVGQGIKTAYDYTRIGFFGICSRQ
jgi:hypothetical protein